MALKSANHDTTRCNILSTFIESSEDDEFWPVLNDQMMMIAETQLKKITSNDPLYRNFQKYLSEALSNKGYLFQIEGNSKQALDLYSRSLSLQKEINYKRGISSNLNNIAMIYKSRGDISTALQYYNENLKTQQEINDKEGMAVSLNNIGIVYEHKGDINKALAYYHKSLSLREGINDKRGMANSFNNLGLVYEGLGDIEKALSVYYKSLNLWEEIGNKSGIATTLNNIGLLHSHQRDYSKALDFYKQSLKLQKEINDKEGIGTSLNNIGYICTFENKTSEALDYYNQSLKIREELQDKNGISVTLNNIGTLLEDQGNNSEALNYYRKSLKIREEINHKEGIAYSLNSIANVLFKKNQTKEALEYAERALKTSRELGFPINIRFSSYLLSKIHAKTENYKAAYEMYMLFKQMSDSVANETNFKSSLKKGFQYAYEKKETEVKFLKQQSEIALLKLNDQKNAIVKQRYLLFFSIGLIALILISAYFYFSRQKLAVLLEKENTIRETEERERQRIAKDIHDELGSGLSKIKFLSELAYADNKEHAHLTSISQTATGLVENMRDLVWAMNPENTTLDNLVARIREYGHDYFEEFPIEFKVDIPDHIPAHKISKEVYRNVFMIVKETFQNIVKHASATLVTLNISVNGKLRFEIRDNGHGFADHTETTGNGLKNIKTRSNFIQARLNLVSEPKKGTVLTLELDIKNTTKVVS